MSTSRKVTSLPREIKEPVPFQTITRATSRNVKMSQPDTDKPSTSNSEDNKEFPALRNSIAPTGIKLPDLWKHNPNGWIDLVETKFRLLNIKDEVVKYVAILEALSNHNLQKLNTIPKSDDNACYSKLLQQIREYFELDDSEEIEFLLNDLTLGDKTPNELMRDLLSAAGEPRTPQFELILKDRFLRALPPKIAGLSGNWSYRSLRELAQCATDAMLSTNRYNQTSLPVFANYRDAPGNSNFGPRRGNSESFGNRSPKRPQNYRPAYASIPRRPPLLGNPHRDFYSFFDRGYNFGYVCYYHFKFREAARNCTGPRCEYFYMLKRARCLNEKGRQFLPLH